MSIKSNCKQLSFFSFIDPNTKIQYYNVAVRQLSCQRRLQKGYAMDLGQRLQTCREAKKKHRLKWRWHAIYPKTISPQLNAA